MTPNDIAGLRERHVKSAVDRTMTLFSWETLEGPENLRARLSLCAGDAAHNALAELSAKLVEVERERDEARAFLDIAVSKAPEPLRALGEYLGRLLDEDQWPEAERYLNAALSTEALTTATARIAELEAALREVRDDLTHERNRDSIVCTIWHSDIETTVDFIDAALERKP